MTRCKITSNIPITPACYNNVRGIQMIQTVNTLDIPIAHIDDAPALEGLLAALRRLHGPDYAFAVRRWAGETHLQSQPGQVRYLFMIEVEAATVTLYPGDQVRGPNPAGAYRLLAGEFAISTGAQEEALWPGDTLTVDARATHTNEGVIVSGAGCYFEVVTSETGYRNPRLAMLRHLADFPAGCAAYPGAFRREAIPPDRTSISASNPRGTNRVNQHTLDMRPDRTPGPSAHYHGPLFDAQGRVYNHSETAIVLPRAAYDLPAVEGNTAGQIRLFLNPEARPAEPREEQLVPVRPGSIVVTPAATDYVVGHCFEDAFAMLVAIPGFIVPFEPVG